MKKTLKNTLIILLSALLTFSCAILLLPRNVKTALAEETNKNIVAETENFSIDKATINTNAFATGKKVLTYGVTVKDSDFVNLAPLLNRITTNYMGTATKILENTLEFHFTLYRNADETGNKEQALVEYVIGFAGYGNENGEFYKFIAKKDHSYYPEKIFFGLSVNPINEYIKKGNYYNSEQINKYKQENFEILSTGISKEGFPVSSKSQTVPFIVETESFTSLYHVEFKITSKIADPIAKFLNFQYNYKTNKEILNSDDPFIKDNKVNQEYDGLEQKAQCVQTVLKDWQTSDKTGFEETFGYYGDAVLQKANDVANEREKKTVTIKYLEQIGNTPFAEAKYKTVDLYVFGGEATEVDVLSALDMDSFKCLDSYGTTVLEENGIWEIVYLHNAHLRVTLPNGRATDYFFDINQSYYEYFYPLTVDDPETTYKNEAILSKECFEYVLNKIGNAYPELAHMDQQNLFDYGNNLYGCWGWVQIPETFDLDTVLKDIFNVSTVTGLKEIGISYRTHLDVKQYQALIETQEFSMFEQFWNDAASFVSGGGFANTYIMVMQPGVNWINQTGNDSPPSDEDPSDGADGISGGFLSGIADKLEKAFKSFMGIFTALTGSPWALGGTMLVIALGVGGFFLIKSGALKKTGSGSRRPRTKNKKRRK